MEKKYWQNFGELNQSEAYQQTAEKEFKEDLLPLEDLDDKGLMDAKSPRRDFLKYLGFSTAAATLATSCEMPVRNVVPYLQRPDNLIPGIPNFYARYIIDPSGQLFGNTSCGVNNFLNYLVYNPPLPHV